MIEKLVGVGEETIEEALKEEITLALQKDHGGMTYKTWMSMPLAQRPKIGLIGSFDMGWQKRASGN